MAMQQLLIGGQTAEAGPYEPPASIRTTDLVTHIDMRDPDCYTPVSGSTYTTTLSDLSGNSFDFEIVDTDNPSTPIDEDLSGQTSGDGSNSADNDDGDTCSNTSKPEINWPHCRLEDDDQYIDRKNSTDSGIEWGTGAFSIEIWAKLNFGEYNNSNVLFTTYHGSTGEATKLPYIDWFWYTNPPRKHRVFSRREGGWSTDPGYTSGYTDLQGVNGSNQWTSWCYFVFTKDGEAANGNDSDCNMYINNVLVKNFSLNQYYDYNEDDSPFRIAARWGSNAYDSDMLFRILRIYKGHELTTTEIDTHWHAQKAEFGWVTS